VQQVITQAHKNNRKVAVVGRSMVNVVKIASELGYLNVPKGIMVEISEVQKMKPEEVVVIMTGSQGEPMAALSRMANGSHRQLEVIPGDTIVLSSTPIPGNESSVNTVINELIRRGADVVLEDTHVSGHACREEIKLLHSLVKPKYFVPVHGEFRHLKAHAELAQELGMNRKNIFVSTIGDVIEVSKDKARKAKSVEAGRVLVDGLGVGDVGNVVLRDRKHLSEDGLIVAVVTVDSKNNKIVGKPELVSRGFVYVKESEELLREAKDVVNKAIEGLDKNRIKEWSYVKNEVKDKLSDYLWRKTKRSPMILPIIVEV
jgi:ribonuclease J